MDIKILGSGCANCNNLEKATREAVDALGLEATFDHVTEPGEIASWGVMKTPALVVDDEGVLYGRGPTAETVKVLLRDRG